MNWLWTSLLWWVIGEIWISIIIVWGRGYINCVLMQWIRPPYSDLYIRFTTTLSYQLFLFLSDAFYWYSWTHMCGGCWLYQSFSVYNKSDIEAESDFQQLIQKCIDLGWTVQIMWWIHIRKRRQLQLKIPQHIAFWLHYNSLYISLRHIHFFYFSCIFVQFLNKF